MISADYYHISNLLESFERRLKEGKVEEVISDLNIAKNAYRKIALDLQEVEVKKECVA